MFKKTRKGLSILLSALIVLTSFQLTMGPKVQAAADDRFDSETGTLTLNASFVAGGLKAQIDAALNPLGKTYSDIKVLIVTEGIVGVGKAADGGSDIAADGIIPKLTNLEDFQLIGNATTQSTSNINSQGTAPKNLFSAANSKLKSVTLHNVTIIEANTFSGVNSLTTLVIPNLKSVANSNAFSGVTQLASITLGATPPTTGPALFPATATFYVPANKVNAYKADSVWGSVADRIVGIDDSTDEETEEPPGETEEPPVVVPPVSNGAAVVTFKNSKDNLLDLLAAAGYDSTIPEQAESLKSIVVKVSSGVKKAMANADFAPGGDSKSKSFSNYKNLISFTIEKPANPVDLTWNGNKLPNRAFKGLANLKVVSIGIDTSYIGSSAFEDCISLETAEFGMTRTLGPWAFRNAQQLKSVTFNKTYLPVGLDDEPGPPPAPGDWFHGVDVDNLVILVPTDAVDAFLSDEYWGNLNIQSNGDDTSKDAEDGEPATQSVVIEKFDSKKLKEAIDSPESGFVGKDYGDIKVLTINSGILDPADCTFIATNLKKLEELYIVGTANFTNETIPKNAFEGNRFLRIIKADNVKVIGVKAFNLFESLTEVDFPNVTMISSQAFAQTKGSSVSKLKVAKFPKVQVIEQRAFYYCVNLEHLYLGEIPPTLTVPEGKQGLWFNFVMNMTVHVPSRAVFDEYIKLEHSDQIDWSAMSFVADNGDELPVIPPADPYVDADYDFLREDHTVPYYNGDYKLSLNMYTLNMNINSWIQGRQSPVPLDTFEAIKWAHENGFDAVDITCYYIPGYSNTAMPTPEQQVEIRKFAKEIKEYAAELGIEISGTGIQNNFADPNQARRDLDIERIKFWIEIAAEMGAPVIRVFAGPPPVDIKRTGWAAITRDRITPAIQEIADFAAENYPSVEIGIQNHGDMLATANQVLQQLKWVDRPNVGVVNDTGYYRDFMSTDATQYDWYTDIALILPYSNNFQVKKKPGGAETTELMNLNTVFESIRNSSYRSYIPVELLWNPGDEGYPGSLSEPPYEETKAFLEKMKKAMNDTKRFDIYSDLKALRLSSGALNKEFDAKTTNYTQTVANSVASLTVTPIAAESEATLTVNGMAAESGQPSEPIALNVGVNTITVVVTGADNSTKTYTVDVTRSAPSDSSSSTDGSGAGNTTDTVTSTDGKLTVPAGKIGVVSMDGSAIKITIPAGAANKELKITIEQVLDSEGLLTDKNVLLSPIYELLKNISENFSKPVTLDFVFDPASLKSNQRAGIFYYDEVEKTWVEVAGSKVSGNHITVDVDHFTKFAVLAVDQETDTEPDAAFGDIAGHWAEANIKRALSGGIVNGYPDGTFRPNHTVTRAEFAVMLMNALQLPGEGAALTFTDKAKIGSWAQKAVAQAVEAGIVKGYSDGSFRPDAKITRAEMAVMIANALGLAAEADPATGFADNKDIPSWAKGAVAELKKQGLVEGKGNNTFAPQALTTRAEAVTVLLNMLDRNNQ